MHSFGNKARFTTLVVLASLLAFVLHAKTGITAPAQAANEVRMAVDPTVLPPVEPPEDDLPTEPDSQPTAPEVELPDIENPTPLPRPPAKADATQQGPEQDVTENAEQEISETKQDSRGGQASAPKAEAAPQQEPEQVATPAPSGVGKGSVTKVSMHSTDNRFELTVQCDRPVGDTTYMNLNNPRRLVIDLREPWLLKTRNVVRVQDGAVRHVVMGAHPDRLRLVIHFRTPPKGNITPQFVRTGNKLVVTGVLP